MSENINTLVSELICTRISHDVIGNVGAVANAVELLEEGDMDFIDDIRSILKVSSSVLTARLKFFRLAFGLHNANLEKTDIVEETARNYLKTIGNASYPIELDLELRNPELGRTALLCIMALADTFVKGGKIEAREVDGAFVAITHSAFPLSVEKVSGIKNALRAFSAETPAQYAPIVYLQNMLNNRKKINIIEQDTFGFIIK